MANALNAVLTDKTVLVKADSMAEEYRTIECRLFRVVGGFGAQPFTSSRTVFGAFVFDGSEDRLDGYDVEAIVEPHEDGVHPGEPDEQCPACALARLTSTPEASS